MGFHGKNAYFALKQDKFDTSGSKVGQQKYFYMDFHFRLYYELVARGIFVGILPITILVILNAKTFLALRKFRKSRAEKISKQRNVLAKTQKCFIL